MDHSPPSSSVHGILQARVLMIKSPPANAGNLRDTGFIPGSGKSPEEGKQQPTPVLLPGESHGQRSLAGYGP